MALTATDRELLRRCLHHEPGAWNDFVDRFLGLVYHVIQHTAHLRSFDLRPEDTEDIASQVLLEIVDNDIYQTERQMVSYKDFPAIFENEILPDPNLGLFYGHLSTARGSLLDEMIFYKYTNVDIGEADVPVAAVDAPRSGPIVEALDFDCRFPLVATGGLAMDDARREEVGRLARAPRCLHNRRLSQYEPGHKTSGITSRSQGRQDCC